MSQPPISQHQGAMKPAQKRRTGSGGRRDAMARRAAEKDGRERELPNESSRVQRRHMNVEDVLPLPPDVGARLRGRGRAGGMGPEELLLSPKPLPLPPIPALLLLPPGSVAASVVPSMARSGSAKPSDWLLGPRVDGERMVEYEGSSAPGATAVSSASSPSIESESAVTKLPVRSEPASSYTVETSCLPERCDTGGYVGRISNGECEMFKGGRTGGWVEVASVRRELVEVAEIDRFKGRRKNAEYDEPV